jgi:hypothetical protein
MFASRRVLQRAILVLLAFIVPPLARSSLAPIQAEEPKHDIAVTTTYLEKPVEQFHQLGLTATLGGEGTLLLDPNTCQLNPFGDREACTLIAPASRHVQLVLTDHSDPAGKNRRLYAVNGAALPHMLYLVVSPDCSSSRFVYADRSGHRRVLALEQTDLRPSAGPSINEADGQKEATLCQGTYRAHRVSGLVVVFAAGSHPTSGYRTYFELLPIDIHPPEFALRHIAPSGLANPVITPFTTWTSFHATDTIDHVIVHDRRGRHRVPVEQVLEGSGTVQTMQVIGRSKNLSFDEAFQDALKQVADSDKPDGMKRLKVLEIGGRFGGIAGFHELYLQVEATVD